MARQVIKVGAKGGKIVKDGSPGKVQYQGKEAPAKSSSKDKLSIGDRRMVRELIHTGVVREYSNWYKRVVRGANEEEPLLTVTTARDALERNARTPAAYKGLASKQKYSVVNAAFENLWGKGKLEVVSAINPDSGRLSNVIQPVHKQDPYAARKTKSRAIKLFDPGTILEINDSDTTQRIEALDDGTFIFRGPSSANGKTFAWKGGRFTWTGEQTIEVGTKFASLAAAAHSLGRYNKPWHQMWRIVDSKAIEDGAPFDIPTPAKDATIDQGTTDILRALNSSMKAIGRASSTWFGSEVRDKGSRASLEPFFDSSRGKWSILIESPHTTGSVAISLEDAKSIPGQLERIQQIRRKRLSYKPLSTTPDMVAAKMYEGVLKERTDALVKKLGSDTRISMGDFDSKEARDSLTSNLRIAKLRHEYDQIQDIEEKLDAIGFTTANVNTKYIPGEDGTASERRREELNVEMDAVLADMGLARNGQTVYLAEGPWGPRGEVQKAQVIKIGPQGGRITRDQGGRKTYASKDMTLGMKEAKAKRREVLEASKKSGTDSARDAKKMVDGLMAVAFKTRKDPSKIDEAKQAVRELAANRDSHVDFLLAPLAKMMEQAKPRQMNQLPHGDVLSEMVAQGILSSMPGSEAQKSSNLEGTVEAPKHTSPVKVERPRRRRKRFPFTGFVDFQGLRIDIENKKGSTRKGTSPDGEEWATKMHAHYGEIRGTKGVDKDALDVYVGPNHDSSTVVVVHQNDPATGKYDEDKVMLGYDSPEEALGCYLKQYDRPGFLGEHTVMPIGAFWRWATGSKAKLGRRVELSKGKDLLPGGLADDKKAKDFDKEQLHIGTKHELEHTSDWAVAREIAMDHLAEDPQYYVKLAKMEAEKGNAPKPATTRPTRRPGYMHKSWGKARVVQR